MGANTSKSAGDRPPYSVHDRGKDLVDFGSVLPNGVYPTTEQDYDLGSVRYLIAIRKLAPFYKGLSEPPMPSAASTHLSKTPSAVNLRMNKEHGTSCGVDLDRPPSGPSCHRTVARMSSLYSNPVECPICFLYYPANINYSRCCDQPLCTECFLQIKRSAEAPTSAATCPFCMQDNFGVVYLLSRDEEPLGVRHTTSGTVGPTLGSCRPSLGYQDLNVVLVDHVRPTAAITNSNRFTSTIRDLDMDLEEWMVMEAIRQSLAEQESVPQS